MKRVNSQAFQKERPTAQVRVLPLPEGKLPIETLTPVLKSISSTAKGNLLVPPSVGVDVGVTRTHGKYVVTSSDPITGTEKRMGWHAVNVSANDVATSGIMPDTLTVVGMFPPGTTTRKILELMEEIHRTASGLEIAVAGGHTEITPELVKPIVVITAIGSGNRFVTAAGAKVGDSILMTKSAGIEGASIIAGLPKVKKLVPPAILRSCRSSIENMSIVREAKLAFATGKVHAMHDTTEGGVLGAILEMSLASNLGFEFYEDKVPLSPPIRELCSRLSLDPLRLLGSGSLLIACKAEDEARIVSELGKHRIACVKIAKLVAAKKGRVVFVRNSNQRKTVEEISIQDELWPALKKFSKHAPGY